MDPDGADSITLERWQSERGLWKLDPVIRFYQKVETACYALLAISGIGAVLYSVSAIIRCSRKG
jgi:hypothetical protein